MATSVIRRKVTNRIWEYVKDYFQEQRLREWPVIQNISFKNITGQKKAVVCYRTISYLIDLDNTSTGRTQPYEILSIVNALSKQGYNVDIIDCNDITSLSIINGKKYDLIFGFGETFYHLTQRNPEAISILYMTEHHPEFSYREEQKRVSYFNERHNRNLKIARSGAFYRLEHLKPVYSSVIVMGEAEPFKELYEHIYSIFPTGLQHPDYTYHPKDHAASRKHFLWLGTTGAAIHKGLDLLLDIFSNREDIVLHIGGITKKDKKLLNFPNKENIVDHGFINVKSKLFLELADKCSYILLPSCSEGFATSVTTGMLHGLIPVVMKDTGFNRLGNHAVFLDDFTIGYLENQLAELASRNPTELERISKSAFEFAHQNFTVETFEKNMCEALNQITASYDKRIT